MKNASTSDTSPSNKNLEALVELAIQRASSAQNLILGTEVTYVFRPGEPNPQNNVFNDFALLYSRLSNVDGPRILQIDDSIISPAVIPANTYNLFNVALAGTLESTMPGSGGSVLCNLEDGVIFTNVATVTNGLHLTSLSTSVPVFTIDSNVLLLQRGASIANDPTSTVPFIKVLTGEAATIVCTLGGTLGTTNNHVVDIDAGSQLVILLDVASVLPNDVLSGAGNSFTIVTSQSTFLNTPNPMLQPALPGFTNTVFDFANFVSFQNLNAVDWVPPPPANVEEAINRMAALLVVLSGGPIP